MFAHVGVCKNIPAGDTNVTSHLNAAAALSEKIWEAISVGLNHLKLFFYFFLNYYYAIKPNMI